MGNAASTTVQSEESLLKGQSHYDLVLLENPMKVLVLIENPLVVA